MTHQPREGASMEKQELLELSDIASNWLAKDKVTLDGISVPRDHDAHVARAECAQELILWVRSKQASDAALRSDSNPDRKAAGRPASEAYTAPPVGMAVEEVATHGNNLEAVAAEPDMLPQPDLEALKLVNKYRYWLSVDKMAQLAIEVTAYAEKRVRGARLEEAEWWFTFAADRIAWKEMDVARGRLTALRQSAGGAGKKI